MTLAFSDARTLVDGAHAFTPGKALSIAVVDYDDFIVPTERMDGAGR
ncbi:hypothetical protein [Pseudofrankia sp. BMG5.36]|nr:hypothetical protein [Pseudofrankia sp. BMG5.36]